MKRILTSLTKPALTLAAFALLLGLTGAASAQFAPAPAPASVNLVGGFWKVDTRLDDGSPGYLAAMFRADGTVTMGKFDAQGRILLKFQGTYRLQGDTLVITIEGKPYNGKVTVISANQIKVGPVTWNRVIV